MAYSDAGLSDAASVMKFDGNSWVSVGFPGFTPGEASWTVPAFDSTGQLYMAFMDAGYGFKASVMEFNGTIGPMWGMQGSLTGMPMI